MRKVHMTAVAAALGIIMAAGHAVGEEGFTSLFDGETLDGWRVTKENPDSFLVEDGVLIARGDRAHLFYNGPVGGADFRNFELRLKARTTEGSNSGVYFHTTYQDEGWPDAGYEAQVNSTQSDPRKTGSLYGVADIYVPGPDDGDFIVRYDGASILVAQPAAPSVDGEWFDYAIAVKDRKITIKVNGETTVEWVQPDHWERGGRRLASGTIALQAHDPDSEVHYKDIRIKLLD